MEIFRAWFVWGESDLFFPGVILLLIFVLLPWREGEKKRNAILIICSVVVYWVCETIVSYYPPGGALQYLLLFVGGIALAILFGGCALVLGRSFANFWMRVETGVPEIT